MKLSKMLIILIRIYGNSPLSCLYQEKLLLPHELCNQSRFIFYDTKQNKHPRFEFLICSIVNVEVTVEFR